MTRQTSCKLKMIMRLDHPELIRDQTKSLTELEDTLSALRKKRKQKWDTP